MTTQTVDMAKVAQLAQAVPADIKQADFMKVFNEMSGTEHTTLADILNSMKAQELQAYMLQLTQAATGGSARPAGAPSKWDRNTEEGRRNQSLASQRSVAKRKAREAQEKQDLLDQLEAAKAAKDGEQAAG